MLQKKRIFPFIFAVSHLRSLSAFAIVPCGPGFSSKNKGFSLVAGLESFGAESKIQEDKQTKWQLSH